MLSWSSEERGSARVVAPAGRIDESNAAEFTERLVAEAASTSGRMVIDLAGIAYMSSRGLRALTLAQRKGAESGATIALARPNEVMREILAISRYDMVFKVHDSVDDALSGG